VSIFESERSEDEPWLQEHKKHFQTQKKQTRRPPANQLQMSGVTNKCQHCQRMAPMELFRDGKCLACQVTDYLGPTP